MNEEKKSTPVPLVNGGAGDDLLVAGLDNDALFGGAGVDRQVGGGGDDLLLGDDITLQVQAGWTLTRWVEVSGSGDAESKNYRYSTNGAQTELATEGDDTLAPTPCSAPRA